MKKKPAFQTPGTTPLLRPPRRWLTYDEIEGFNVLGKPAQVRIRIWQGTDLSPAVLVSQIPAQPSPKPVIVWIANFINESFLHFSHLGMLLFEDSETFMGRSLTQHVFEEFGHFARRRLCHSHEYAKSWDFLRFVVQDPHLKH